MFPVPPFNVMLASDLSLFDSCYSEIEIRLIHHTVNYSAIHQPLIEYRTLHPSFTAIVDK
jgi:hypothetical protein